MAVTQHVYQLLLKQSAPTVTVIIKWLSSMEVAWDPRSMEPSIKSIFLFCFVLSKWRNTRGRTRHVGRSSRPTALSVLVQTWADASMNRRLHQTLSPDPERPRYILPPFKSKQSLSLGRLFDGREELGSLGKKLPVGPSLQ